MSGDWEAGIDAAVSEALSDLGVIAVVGLSPRAERDSHRVAAYLQGAGYRIVPINPAVAGRVSEILGERVYGSLSEVGFGVDTVCVFRRSEETDVVIDEAIGVGAGRVWLQLGIRNRAGLERARGAGLGGVEDRCLMVEHGRAVSEGGGLGQA